MRNGKSRFDSLRATSGERVAIGEKSDETEFAVPVYHCRLQAFVSGGSRVI